MYHCAQHLFVLLFLIIYVGVCVCACVSSAPGEQKKVSNPLGLALQEIGSHLIWVWESNLGPLQQQ